MKKSLGSGPPLGQFGEAEPAEAGQEPEITEAAAGDIEIIDDIQEPNTEDGIISLLGRATQYISRELNMAMARYRMEQAERGLKRGDEFKLLRAEASGVMWAEPLEHQRTGDWERYLKLAERERRGIREETVKSFLALRKAREAATPEERQELHELFQRQVEMMKLMHTPEYMDHLAVLKNDMEANLGWLKGKLEKLEKEGFNPQQLGGFNEWVAGSGVDPKVAMGVIAEIEAAIEREKLQKRISETEKLLRDLEIFIEVKQQKQKTP